MLVPKAAFSSQQPPTGQPATQQQLSLISAIAADLEALARKGAKGFVFFPGNSQLQGPASLNPLRRAKEAEGEQASLSPKETKGLVRNPT